MESKNRNAWIVIVAVLVVACCCFLAVTVAVLGSLAARSSDFDLGGLHRERIGQTFEAGDAPALDITNFAGSVTIRSGGSDVIHVVAVKKASSRSKLGQIVVQMSEREGRVVIRSRTSRSLSNATVDLEITAPADASLDLSTGAGTVDVRGITGRLDVDNGAGTISVREAQGSVRLASGAGTIDYQGTPAGNCSFQTGAGTIMLRLPANLNVEVDLGTAMGSVGVDYSVDGLVTLREVRGVIGDGSQGSIYAHTGVGTIILARR